MSDAYMSINFAALQQAHDDPTAHHKALQSHLETLEAELESRLAHWDGAAKEAYYQAKQHWHGRAAHMHAVLVQVQSHFANLNEIYPSAEASNVNIWQ